LIGKNLKTLELRRAILEEKYLKHSCTKWEWVNDDNVMIYGNYDLIEEYKNGLPPFHIIFNEPGYGFTVDPTMAYANYLMIRTLINHLYH